jgi:glycerol-3-phosphate dehydrogenase (NAD(P)+)
MDKVGIIGGGAWGTALASVASAAGAQVTLWARETEVVDTINRRHENPLFLPGARLPANITATEDPADLAHSEAWIFAVPAQFTRMIMQIFAPYFHGQIVTLATKGIETTTGELITEIASEMLPAAKLTVLSGPTFAIEVAHGLPTAVTLASKDRIAAITMIDRLGGPHFRPYFSDDPVGVEVGGAIKNVLAIACGIVQGRKLGDNARAALITRGLAEMARLGVALGARPETFMGLSGLGDLVLTCSSPQSRNMSLGIALGEGRTLQEVLAERRSVAEGVATARAVTDLAARLKVEMPICTATDAVLHQGAKVDDAIGGLLSRPFRPELPGMEA